MSRSIYCLHCDAVKYTPTIIGEQQYCIMKKSVMMWAIHVITKHHIGGTNMATAEDLYILLKDCILQSARLCTEGIRVRTVLVSRTKKKHTREWEHLHGWIAIDDKDDVSKKKFQETYDVNDRGNFNAIDATKLRNKPIENGPRDGDKIAICTLGTFLNLMQVIQTPIIYVFADNFGDYTNLDDIRVRVTWTL
jgi:hypothetical protein